MADETFSASKSDAEQLQISTNPIYALGIHPEAPRGGILCSSSALGPVPMYPQNLQFYCTNLHDSELQELSRQPQMLRAADRVAASGDIEFLEPLLPLSLFQYFYV